MGAPDKKKIITQQHYFHKILLKGNENDPKKMAENRISRQPINENGIRLLRVKRFWNQPTYEERKTVLRHVFPCFFELTNRD